MQRNISHNQGPGVLHNQGPEYYTTARTTTSKAPEYYTTTYAAPYNRGSPPSTTPRRLLNTTLEAQKYYSAQSYTTTAAYYTTEAAKYYVAPNLLQPGCTVLLLKSRLTTPRLRNITLLKAITKPWRLSTTPEAPKYYSGPSYYTTAAPSYYEPVYYQAPGTTALPATTRLRLLPTTQRHPNTTPKRPSIMLLQATPRQLPLTTLLKLPCYVAPTYYSQAAPSYCAEPTYYTEAPRYYAAPEYYTEAQKYYSPPTYYREAPVLRHQGT
ncbi:proteoglycan 4-like [Daphnia magna]|uniref:proteoglycan 4-like n=1 Tax=Daphnia magna TaxID=35525 RepID=UPI001E1BC3FD|nr:proteoglycan 4-like [Daphnia magna]